MPPAGAPNGSANDRVADFQDDPISVLRLGLGTIERNPTQSDVDMAVLAISWGLGQSFGGAVYAGQRDWVTSATLSPDGQKLFTASLDAMLRVWDVETATPKGTLSLGRPARYFAGRPQVSSDSKLVLVTTVDGKVRLGPWQDQTELPVLWSGEGDLFATRSTLGFDDDTVAIGCKDGTVRVLRRSVPGAEPLVLGAANNDQVTSLVFSSQNLLASGSEAGVVRLWDLGDPPKPILGYRHDDTVRTVTFDAKGRWLASASDDTTAKLINVISGDHPVVDLLGHTEEVLTVVFSRDASIVVTGGVDGTARVHGLPNGELVAVLEGHTDEILDVDVALDNRTVATASDDGTVRLWDGPTGGALVVLRIHQGHVFTVQHGKEGRVFTAGSDNTARRTDANLGLVLGGATARVNKADFDGTGGRVLTASDDGSCRIYDGKSGRQIGKLLETRPVNTAVFNETGDLVLTATGNVARIWDWRENRLVRELRHDGEINTAGFSPNGQLVVTTLHPPTSIGHATPDTDHGMIWNLQTGQRFPLRLPPEDAEKPFAILAEANFSPDNMQVAGAQFNKAVHVWSATGNLRRSLRDSQGFVYHCSFSPDNRHVVAAGGDATARIWNVETGEQRHVLRSPSVQLRCVAYSKDGTRLAVGTADRRVAIWELPSERLLAVVRRHAGAINSVLFHPTDHNRILTASDDRTARLFPYEPLGSFDEVIQAALQRERLFRSASA